MRKAFKPKNNRGRRIDRGDNRAGTQEERPERKPSFGKPQRYAQGRGFAKEAEPSGPAGFSALLMTKARAAFPDMIGSSTSPEPLARLDYARELELKNAALQEFWTAHGLPDKPNRIHPSPKPRHYRFTTKRSVIENRGRIQLDFHQEKAPGVKAMGPASLLEPAEHQAIYAFLLEKLNHEAYSGLAHALNYLVIRGDYTRFSVFFNVHRLNAGIVRKAKLLADHLRTMNPGGKINPAAKVISAFIFFDPGRSSFYLDLRTPEGPWKLKKLFGPDQLRMQVGAREYVFGPIAFTQVNGSILPDFLEKAEQLLKPKSHQRLLDLYCGFGFFSLHLAAGYAEVLGVEASTDAIDSAKAMVALAKPQTGAAQAKGPTGSAAAKQPTAKPKAAPAERPTGKLLARFKQGRIQTKSLDTLLPKADGTPEALLLDPPRQGVEAGVIRALAMRQPVRVLHVFCDMDVLPREVNAWRKCGYMVSKVVPLDMFPGTDNLEVMVLFIPDRYGILNRLPVKDDFAEIE
jgi:tRNA/tmRNA/rRNA uracil-C5-methylase (TrmA/RlmC/RlmD family)